MRILFAGLVLIVLVVLYGGRQLGLDLPSAIPTPENTIWLHIFGLFALYLLCEGLAAVFFRRRESLEDGEPREAQDSVVVLHEELRKLTNENDRLLKRLDVAEHERERLAQDLDRQTAELRSRAETLRPEQIEAELIAFLAVLQEKARLVDFAMDDIGGYSDAQVGAAARVVHTGLRAVLNEYFKVRPLLNAKEGEAVRIDGEYDAKSYRLLGRVPDRGPYSGVLVHPGWKTEQVTLPRVLDEDARGREVISPAEVEIK